MADANVTTEHPDLKATMALRTRCRDLVAGSDTVKSKGTEYLPRPAGMADEDYEFYKARAQYFNAISRTVTALSGAVFPKEPTVEVPEAVRGHLQDLTLRDEPLDVVAQRVVTQVLTEGRYAILVEMPAVPEGEAAPINARPYWVTIEAERVINWRSARVGADPEQLVMVVISEDAPVASWNSFSHDTKIQYRELGLVGGVYQMRTWTTSTTEKNEWVPGPWITPTRRGKPLDFIPFTFIGTDGITSDVTRPPLVDLADVSIGHYRNSADHEHGLFFTAIPVPWASGVTGDGALRYGPSVVWRLSEGGQAGLLEFTGSGMQAIRDAMAAKERLMATLGARLLEDPHASSAETATAVRMRHSGEGATLRTIAGAASAGLTRVLRWHVWWFTGTGNLPLDVKVELPRDFFQIKASPDEVHTALDLVESKRISFETFYTFLLTGQWTRDGITAEEELAAIEAERSKREEDEAARSNEQVRLAIERALAKTKTKPPEPGSGAAV